MDSVHAVIILSGWQQARPKHNYPRAPAERSLSLDDTLYTTITTSAPPAPVRGDHRGQAEGSHRRLARPRLFQYESHWPEITSWRGSPRGSPASPRSLCLISPDCLFVHAADLHLDSPFIGLSGRLGSEFGELAVRASLESMGRLFALAREREADFMVVSGDLYDGAKVGVRAKVAFLDEVRKAGAYGLRVLVALGNHDPVDESWFRPGELPDNLHLFAPGDPEKVSFVTRSGRQVEVAGVSYRRRRETENLALRFPPADRAAFSVAVLHANVGGNPNHDSYAPASLDDLTRLGYDYFALGHIHRQAVLCERPMVVYSGTLQGRSMKESELGPKGAMLVRHSATDGLSADFVELATVRFERVEVEVPEGGETALVEAMADGVMGVQGALGDLSGLVVRVTLTGSASDFDPEPEFLEEAARALRDRVEGLERPRVFVESLESKVEGRFDLAEVSNRPDLAGLLARMALEAPPLEVDLPTLAGGLRGRALNTAAVNALREIAAEGLLGPAKLAEVAERACRLAIGPLVGTEPKEGR